MPFVEAIKRVNFIKKREVLQKTTHSRKAQRIARNFDMNAAVLARQEAVLIQRILEQQETSCLILQYLPLHLQQLLPLPIQQFILPYLRLYYLLGIKTIMLVCAIISSIYAT